MEETGMESVCSVLIKHLPEAIPQETLIRLFSHYGASSVRPCTSSRLRNCAFVDFKNITLASQAQQQLNGLRFLGKILLVERCTKQVEEDKVQKNDAQIGNDFTSSMSLMKESTGTRDVNERSKSGALPATSEPIAAKLGVDYEFPPQLEYAYPPPDGNILTNIVNALIAVPRFYTQVLHLMNKMNIPAPFRIALPTPPLPPSVPAPAPPPPPPSMPSKPNLEDLSSDESEMESSDEEVGDKNAGVPQSRRKRIKREAIVGPAIDKGVAHEAVGLKSATLVPKEIPLIKKKNPVLQIKITPKIIQKDHIEDSNMEESREQDIDDIDLVPYATAEDLQSGKLPPEEILSLPMFKNYTAGQPGSVLYLKNLSKDVVVDDLYFIFGSLFGSLDAAKSGLRCVKLMQEGRMRGQAFLTFPSVELAHQALNLVHGYVFKGKPMIIQFGRNPASAKS